MFHLVERAKIVEGAAPAADAAGRTADYVSLSKAAGLFIVVHITQGNAATVALTPYQAKTVAAGSEKVLTQNVNIWSNLDTAASDALVRRTDAANYTTDAGVKNKIVVFYIPADTLDTSNDFDCVTIKTGASHASNITQVMYYLTDIAYPQATPPSAIVD